MQHIYTFYYGLSITIMYVIMCAALSLKNKLINILKKNAI